jgi:cyclomaltodextrinase
MRTKRRQVTVPDWARDAVWYQIFPERFRNGDPANDPTAADAGCERVAGWKICDWGMDWYQQADWERPLGDFFRSVYHRRFGGDLIGVRKKLDYLQELGVNAIYLNPVFMAESLHKYDGSSFHHVDPTFGPDRAGDLAALAVAGETEDPRTWIWTAADRCLLDLIGDVHRRGMKIILDGVFNHTGRRFFAFQDLLRNGRRSRYQDWYRINKWKRDGTFTYQGWFNHAGLPELGRNGDNLARPVRDYIHHITRRWMDPDGDGDPSDGIDGWRLDVAFCVPAAFWREWRRRVKTINPEAYLTAEIVTLAREYLEGDQFDAVMNYMWLYPTVSFFSPGANAIDRPAFQKAQDDLRAAYPDAVNYVQQNLLDSHDLARIATMLENPDAPRGHWEDYFNASRVKNRPEFVTTRPGPAAWRALRQAAIFQMTYIGAPMLYYGTEVGMWGANDPDNRQPMLWDDVKHRPERRAYGRACRAQPRKPDRELFSFYRRAIALRKRHPVLRRGRLRWLDTRHPRLLAYERYDGRTRIQVFLNASDEPAPAVGLRPGRDLWNPGARPVTGKNVVIAPRGWRIVQVGK